MPSKTISLDAAKTSGTSPSLQPRGLRIKQAAEYLGTSPWWVEVAIREKRIPAYKPNTNYYLIFREDLDAFVDRLRQGDATGAA